jgi:hypothetical protein
VHEDISRLSALLANHYWYRLWVLQELAVSKHIVVQCGAVTTTFDAIDALVQSVPSKERLPVRDDELFPMQGIARMRRAAVIEQSLSLQKVFGIRRAYHDNLRPLAPGAVINLSRSELKVTHAKDKVYGILGLLSKVPGSMSTIQSPSRRYSRIS